MVQQTREIMGEVLKDHVAVILFDHDFTELDYVVVVQGLEKLDFSNRGDRELNTVRIQP